MSKEPAVRRLERTTMDAQSWDERYSAARDGEGLWSAQPHAALAQIVTPLAPGTALDLATGDGRNGIWLAERGWQVTAVDFSAAGLAVARTRDTGAGAQRTGSIDWQLADVTRWNAARAYDLITMTYLQLAEQAIAEVITRASRWLAPGGTLVVIGHDRDNLTGGTGGPQDPAVLYTPDMLRAAADGLRILAARQLTRNPATDPESPGDNGQSAIDTLLHAVKD
ncbi:class I SAM-dependent methyltransferase [Paeniglutamicibacter antarcticus]|uniref:Class I SAM-dependent methyltransferase n=1 Tax=Arthrobacter terrae TaxID=2935737 RepID=A0A931CNJ0_9MICC|nr:class I SAM-dependent methyltransferase [Arthrobacter terrae]MBG0738076.1 class I SAM-dependent methyltransferase [Arthrobacter terrae]